MGEFFDKLSDEDKKVAEALAFIDYKEMPASFRLELYRGEDGEATFKAMRTEDIARHKDTILAAARQNEKVMAMVAKASTAQGGRAHTPTQGRRDKKE